MKCMALLKSLKYEVCTTQIKLRLDCFPSLFIINIAIRILLYAFGVALPWILVFVGAVFYLACYRLMRAGNLCSLLSVIRHAY